MGANSWLWFALIAFLVFCCVLPMLLMGRRRGRPRDAAREEDKDSGE